MKQTPKKKGNYLYHDETDGTRTFAVSVHLPEGATEWQECTAKQKADYEAAHQPANTDSEISEISETSGLSEISESSEN